MARSRGLWAELQREQARRQQQRQQSLRVEAQAAARARREYQQAVARQATTDAKERKRLYLEARKAEAAFEADIRACFDEISHTALMNRLRVRIKDKRICTLAKAFLKSGIFTELGDREDTITGTPQGGILTPPTQRAISASRSRWVTGV